MAVEQAVFKALRDKAVADTGSGGLWESGGANSLLHGGGFRLDGSEMRTRDLPRIDVSPPPLLRQDASGLDVWDGLWRMRVLVRKDRAFGTGDTPEAAGVLSGILDRVNAVYDKATVSVSGYTPSTLSIGRIIPGPGDDETVVRVVEFQIMVHE
jgi:hypothetical protein